MKTQWIRNLRMSVGLLIVVCGIVAGYHTAFAQNAAPQDVIQELSVTIITTAGISILLVIAITFFLFTRRLRRVKNSLQAEITDRKQAEMKLKASLEETRLRQMEVSALLEASQAIPLCKTFHEAARKIFDICKDHILINLLGNAVKFTETGKVTLEVAKAPENKDSSFPDLPQPSSEHLLFTISDTGPGIAREERESIFAPFKQSSRSAGLTEGTGLGLSISRKFVQLMGGHAQRTAGFYPFKSACVTSHRSVRATRTGCRAGRHQGDRAQRRGSSSP